MEVGVDRVGDDAAKQGAALVRIGLNAPEQVVGGVDGHEVGGGDGEDVFGDALAHRHGEPAADDVAEHVVNHHVEVEVLVHVLLLQELDGGDDAAPGATDARLRAARLDAVDAAEPFENGVVGVNSGVFAQQIEHRGNVLAAAQGVGRIRLGVAAELHDLQAGLGERSADVRGGRRLADAPFAVNGDLFDLFSHLQSLRCAAKTERGLGGTFAASDAVQEDRERAASFRRR